MKFIANYLHKRKIRNGFKQFFLTIPQVSNLFFDVGANVGEKTEEYLSLGKKVVAIEPQQNCLKVLKEKFGTNPSVTIVDCGLGKKAGTAKLYISERYTGFSSLDKNWQKGTKYGGFNKSVAIKIVPLESLIQKYGLPDFCKIDVEGYEFPVLQGLVSKIPYLSFEYHGNNLPEIKKCLDLLAKRGYKKFTFSESDNPPEPEWLSKNALVFKLKNTWGDIYAR